MGLGGTALLGDTIVNTDSFKSNFGDLATAVMSNTPGAEVDFTFSGNPSVATANLEIFLGLTIGSLNAIATSNVIEGAAIKQTFYGNANDILSFDFQFLTDEDVSLDFSNPHPGFNDFSFYTLQFSNSPSNVFQLADTFSNFNDSRTPFISETNAQNRSFSLAETGYYTIGFGVVDVGDESFASALSVDNVALVSSKPVPEPASLLGLTAFSFGAFMKRRHWKKAEV